MKILYFLLILSGNSQVGKALGFQIIAIVLGSSTFIIFFFFIFYLFLLAKFR